MNADLRTRWRLDLSQRQGYLARVHTTVGHKLAAHTTLPPLSSHGHYVVDLSPQSAGFAHRHPTLCGMGDKGIREMEGKKDSII